MLKTLATAICVLLPAPLASAAPAAVTRVFSGWTVSCDNLGACVTLGTASDANDLVYLRIARAAGAAAAPEAKLVIAIPDGAKGPFTLFSLTAVTTIQTGDTKIALEPAQASAAADDKSYVSARFGGASSIALIAALRDASRLEVAIARESGVIELKGLSAALRFMDDRQGRVGGPTALVAKGMTPVGQVPDPAATPIVVPAPPGSVTDIETPIVTPALVALASKGCELEAGKPLEDVKAWRLAPDRTLVGIPCGMGAYNFQTALFFTDAAGKPLGPVTLPRSPADVAPPDASNLVTNGDFDPKTMELNEFAKNRGLGDCGLLMNWVWTGSAFEILSASGLDACPGAFSQDWPNFYTAARKR